MTLIKYIDRKLTNILVKYKWYRDWCDKQDADRKGYYKYCSMKGLRPGTGPLRWLWIREYEEWKKQNWRDWFIVDKEKDVKF